MKRKQQRLAEKPIHLLTFAPDKGETTYPLLSDRRNIVVIADEAHRSQYDFIDGFAKHIRDGLPNASFIGFRFANESDFTVHCPL